LQLGAKRPLFEPFIVLCYTDLFAKTGSGQTYGKLKTKDAFSLRAWRSLTSSGDEEQQRLVLFVLSAFMGIGNMGSYTVLRALLADRFQGGETMVALATQGLFNRCGGETPFCIENAIILPRQAPDKHSNTVKASKNEHRFLQQRRADARVHCWAELRGGTEAAFPRRFLRSIYAIENDHLLRQARDKRKENSTQNGVGLASQEQKAQGLLALWVCAAVSSSLAWQVRKHLFCAMLYIYGAKNDHCTKTGSGHT
jgi:hypothetical protein